MQAGDAGDGGDHHARKKLHGGHVALVECAGGRGQNLEYAQGAAIVAKRRDEDGADAEVGSGAASAGAADDFIAGAQCDGGSGSSGEMLGTLGDGADGGFEIEL